MKEFLKYCLLFAVMTIAAIYIYYLVILLSPATDIFAPVK